MLELITVKAFTVELKRERHLFARHNRLFGEIDGRAAAAGSDRQDDKRLGTRIADQQVAPHDLTGTDTSHIDRIGGLSGMQQ